MHKFSMASIPLRAIVSDIARWKSELQQPLLGDVHRLENILRTRGMGIVLTDLPDVGKAYDRALSRGYFDFSELPLSCGSFEKRKILFHSLLMETMDPLGIVDEGADPTAVFFTRQLFYLFKKLQVDFKAGSVFDATLAFVATDSSLRRPSHDWSDPTSFGYESKKKSAIAEAYSDYCDRKSLFEGQGPAFGFPTLSKLVHVFEWVCDAAMAKYPLIQDPYESFVPRHGPGAVSDGRKGDDKFLFPSWPERTRSVFDPALFSSTTEETYHHAQHLLLDPRELPAKLLAVPKTYNGPRLITAEPTALQFLQQGIRRWLLAEMPRSLKRCIDIKDQGPSRDAALLSSSNGKAATVDLSSASDRLSLWTIEQVFESRPDILACLAASRSLFVRNATEEPDAFSHQVLRKYAGQGNATTFVIQSMVYTLVAIAATLVYHGYSTGHGVSRNWWKVTKSIRVFGDDIIVATEVVPYLDLLLNFLQLKVNGSKTHASGSFRESCGMDAYKGVDVTPLYLSNLTPGNKAESLMSWLDVSNNAWQKGLWDLATWMDTELPCKLATLVPISHEPLSCLSRFTFLNGVAPGSLIKYNNKLHRHDILGLTPVVKEVKRERDGYSDLYAYLLSTHREPDVKRDRLRYLSLRKETNVGTTVKTTVHLRKSWVQAPAW
uniref:RNA-directed RNA polymerase n=1 Tax=Wenling levi-like virus 1 TaxID=1923497 RepID=A0A1L3KIJ8_9VIRU|nr:hypothetical protein [Wenling levi-like virus 1]